MVVNLAQSAATASAYAVKHGAHDPNGDLLGLCAANLAAGLGRTFVVNGRPPLTALAESAGGRSQLALGWGLESHWTRARRRMGRGVSENR